MNTKDRSVFARIAYGVILILYDRPVIFVKQLIKNVCLPVIHH